MALKSKIRTQIFRVNMASGYRTSVEAMDIIRQCGDEIRSGTWIHVPFSLISDGLFTDQAGD